MIILLFLYEYIKHFSECETFMNESETYKNSCYNKICNKIELSNFYESGNRNMYRCMKFMHYISNIYFKTESTDLQKTYVCTCIIGYIIILWKLKKVTSPKYFLMHCLRHTKIMLANERKKKYKIYLELFQFYTHNNDHMQVKCCSSYFSHIDCNNINILFIFVRS
ncbi:variable surface protein [Plasmodium gonderi]|uniref:Variable surface protein n=1 Tax=Plasmodium gonderi TaxID=77519 RepID=A0A1Y1JNN9_PLAGO|nr:variable surface protein [Plasmodium gonderi]GAW84081.1 variable surface protein [Plasmodium gonderi]